MKFALICLLLPVLALAGCASSGVSRVVPALEGADIVILGEVHDNADHHRNQAELISALQPAAVVFEMLTPEQATTVNEMTDRDQVLREALAWQESGWPDWGLYQPLFAALEKVPVYGMAVPGPDVNRAVTEGAAAVFGTDAERFGLAAPLPPAQQADREAHQQAVHCDMLPPTLLPGMVEAQRLRDAAFARTALQALTEQGGPVVVVTGTGHARRDWGMPAALAAAAPTVSVVSLGQLEAPPAAGAPFDAWLVAEPAPRDDPCEAFAARK